MAKKEVAKKENTNLSTDVMGTLEQFASDGLEKVTARDVKLPIIKVLTSNSPALNESDSKYNEDARPGDIFNEVSNRVYKGKKGMLVVPCYFVNTFNEWADRGESAGRPVAIHGDPAIMKTTQRADDGKDRTQDGTYIEDTGNHFVFILDENYNPVESALITMKSTQKKKSRLWNSMMMSKRMQGKNGFFTPPSWASVYRLTTVQESNSKGTWYGWVTSFDRFLDQPTDSALLENTKSFSETARKLDMVTGINFDDEGTSSTVNSTSEVIEGDSSVPF
tara:strand:- start:7082 stop:7915 length:834 start_codon:yes stop_codon:yes gene_type:complete